MGLPPAGLSQTLAWAAGWARPASVSDFVNLLKSKAVSEQLVLLPHGPRAGEPEALAQPEHRLEPLDGAPRRVEEAEAADPRHVLLQPEVVALDALLQVLGDVVDRGGACR